MYKFLVLGAVLSLLGNEILCAGFSPLGPPPYFSQIPSFDRMRMRPFSGPFGTSAFYQSPETRNFISPPTSPPPPPPQEDLKDVEEVRNLVKKLEDLASSLSQQTPTDSSPTQELSSSMNTVGKLLSSEYVVTQGIGAHKLHLRMLPWNKARKVCIDEGGQLADITSDSEEKIILRLMAEESIEAAWVGYHDMFQEGDWVTVLGEPLGKSGWDRWWKKRLPNPDNQDNEDCASLMIDGGGMNDRHCEDDMPFVCKITAL